MKLNFAPLAVQTSSHAHESETDSETLEEIVEALFTGGFEHSHSHEDSADTPVHSHTHQHTVASAPMIADFLLSSFYFTLPYVSQTWNLRFTLPAFNSYQSVLLRPPIRLA